MGCMGAAWVPGRKDPEDALRVSQLHPPHPEWGRGPETSTAALSMGLTQMNSWNSQHNPSQHTLPSPRPQTKSPRPALCSLRSLNVPPNHSQTPSLLEPFSISPPDSQPHSSCPILFPWVKGALDVVVRPRKWRPGPQLQFSPMNSEP